MRIVKVSFSLDHGDSYKWDSEQQISGSSNIFLSKESCQSWKNIIFPCPWAHAFMSASGVNKPVHFLELNYFWFVQDIQEELVLSPISMLTYANWYNLEPYLLFLKIISSPLCINSKLVKTVFDVHHSLLNQLKLFVSNGQHHFLSLSLKLHFWDNVTDLSQFDFIPCVY